MKKTLPVAKLDIARYFWKFSDSFEQFNFAKHDELRSLMKDQTEELGYETHNSLINLSTLALVCLAYMCAVATYGIAFAVLKLTFKFLASKVGGLSGIAHEGGQEETKDQNK